MMNAISGHAPMYSPGKMTETLYPKARQFFELGGRIAESSQNKGYLTRKVGTFVGSKLLNYDYHEFPLLKIGKRNIKISEPAMGSLILLLYLFTVAPRLYRAAQRDKREVGDVLRRDLTAISLFLFALKPMVKFLNKIKEKRDGLKLMDDQAGKVMSYKQFAQNYFIDSPKALEAIVKEGNKKGLLKALGQLEDTEIQKHLNPDEYGKIQQMLNRFKAQVRKMVEAEKDPERFKQLAQEAYQTLMEATDSQKGAIEKLKSTLSEVQFEKVAKKLNGDHYKSFVSRYAKFNRLPADLAGFLMVIGAIGWFPVWFNDVWTRKKHAEKLATHRQQQAQNFDRAAAFQYFSEQSKLRPSWRA